jgi:hypothetical protein
MSAHRRRVDLREQMSFNETLLLIFVFTTLKDVSAAILKAAINTQTRQPFAGRSKPTALGNVRMGQNESQPAKAGTL